MKKLTKKVSKTFNTKCLKGKKHSWSYRGGEAVCVNCKKFIQPSGKITKNP